MGVFYFTRNVFIHPLLCCNNDHSNINCRPTPDGRTVRPGRAGGQTDIVGHWLCTDTFLSCASDTNWNALHLLFWLHSKKGSGIYCGNCNHTCRVCLETGRPGLHNHHHHQHHHRHYQQQQLQMCYVGSVVFVDRNKNWMTICQRMLNVTAHFQIVKLKVQKARYVQLYTSWDYEYGSKSYLT